MSRSDDPRLDANAAVTLTVTGADEALRVSSTGVPTVFHIDDRVAGRYRICSFIAFGGMGEVYEAEDEVLRERIALKTIRSDVADDPEIAARFKREILLARKVTHTNVCRIFDLGIHAPAGQPPQAFLTMELVSGSTLAERIRSGPRISVEEARPIIAQMAAALDAAHREGIVHRDFKSGNVMLTRSGRVVVTDFGLARIEGGDPFSTHANSAQPGMLGSPVYMAPEQVEGRDVTKAADIYALGVVMFEMVTGKVPFTGDNALSCAAKRLTQRAPSARSIVPSLSRTWEQVIARCLERVPTDRFTRAGDVVCALTKTIAEPVFPIRLGRNRRWMAIGAAAILGLTGWFVWSRASTKEVAPAATEPAPRRVLAVLGFKNLAHKDDLDWLSTGISEMLTTELSAGGELRLIPGENLARMKHDLALEDADGYAPDTLGRVQKNIGADYVVLGSYLPLGDKIRLDVRVQETSTGETVLQAADTGTTAELGILVARVGAKLRERLRVGPLSPSEQAIVNAALPTTPQAARAYAEGLARQRVFAMGHARNLFERAIELEPDFPQAHSALAEALSYLGYEARAREEAKTAVDLAGNLPEDERLRVEGQYYMTIGDSERAVGAYATLFARASDNVEWGMRLASAQFAAGNDNAAHETIDRLRALPHYEDDPRVYLVLEQAALMKQDYAQVLELAAKLAAAGEARGAQSLVGEAKGAAALALWFRGDLDEAVRAAEESNRLAFVLGDRDGVSSALITKAWVLTDRGDYAAARAAAEQALIVAAEVGSRRRVWGAEHVLGRAALFTGDLDSASRHFEASRLAAAELGSTYGEALAQLGQAVVMAAHGDLDRAKPIYDQLIAGFRRFAPKHNTAYSLHYYGELMMSFGELGQARQSLEEALAIREEIGERLQAQRDRVALARLALLEGNAPEAERLVRLVLPVLAELHYNDDIASTEAVLARALAAQRQPREAALALARAEMAASRTESFVVQMDLAHARAEAGEPQRTRLEMAIADATAKDWMSRALELRLSRVRGLAATGARSEARTAAQALARAAAARSFHAIAEQARAIAAIP